MAKILRKSAVALAGVAAASALLAGTQQPASALTLMDLLRGGPGNSRSTVDERVREPSSEPAISEPQPVVSGPRYYTYEADDVRAIDVAGLADPVVTGSINDVDAAQPVARQGVSDISVSALVPVAEAIEAHYGAFNGFHWLDGDVANARAEAVQAVLANADSVGLRAADYLVEPPLIAPSGELGAAEKLRYEIELSAAVLTYALDATRGRIDPNLISGYHDFKRKTLDLDAVLNVVTRTVDPARYLEARSPMNGKFRQLVAERERLVAADDVERVDVASDLFLRPGGQSDELANVVEAIKLKASDALKVDHALTFADYRGAPEYSADLVALVEDFQREAGLTVDGVLGPNTVRAMTVMSNAEKVEKIDLAMERLRWLNRDLGERHVFINAASYQVAYTENGEEALAMKVVVGTKSNQTYFFQDTIETVEFNPYWGVPRSIIVNEMLPKLRQDPSYLDRLGYEVTTRDGRRVSSSSVNWYAVGADVPVNVRQPPGSGNALGELKILFPNAHAIYMHDTPAKNLFSRDTRAYSHGCVRLEDPRAMAAAVLGTSRDTIDRHVADGQNNGVEVEGDIPVYVGYFTAWPDGSGTVQYHGDVYDRDSYLMRAMAATNDARGLES